MARKISHVQTSQRSTYFPSLFLTIFISIFPFLERIVRKRKGRSIGKKKTRTYRRRKKKTFIRIWRGYRWIYAQGSS